MNKPGLVPVVRTPDRREGSRSAVAALGGAAPAAPRHSPLGLSIDVLLEVDTVCGEVLVWFARRRSAGYVGALSFAAAAAGWVVWWLYIDGYGHGQLGLIGSRPWTVPRSSGFEQFISPLVFGCGRPFTTLHRGNGGGGHLQSGTRAVADRNASARLGVADQRRLPGLHGC